MIKATTSGSTEFPFPSDLLIAPISRRPLRFASETVRLVVERAVPVFAQNECERLPPHATIVVVTYNNLVVTRLCLESLLADTTGPGFEVIVVDNASKDGTSEYVSELARGCSRLCVVANEVNRGFAGANNQALAMARGEVLVLLNNDTIVPPGWLSHLLKHLDDLTVALVGPVTNRIGNEAEIETGYATYGEMIEFARDRVTREEGRSFDIRTLCMFCLAMRRDVYEQLGPLDERYEIGLLEDDDYSMRAHAAGYRVVCAEDVFVHHFGQASFGSLFASGDYTQVLEANKRRFEEKWGVPWQPYGRRVSTSYTQSHGRIQEIVCEVLPPQARVLVVSRGDEELLCACGPGAMHFPQNEEGGYAGYYPAGSAEALAQVAKLRAAGATHLLFPETARWWLDHYPDFGRYLDSRHRVVADEAGVCLIFDLSSNDA